MLIPDAFNILSEANLKIASLGSDIVDQEGTPRQPKTTRQLIRTRQLFNLLNKFIFLNTGGTAISYTIGQNDAALNRLLLQLKRSAQLTSFPVIPNPIQTFVSTYQNGGTIIIDNSGNISGVNNISITGSLSVIQNVSISGSLTLSNALPPTSGGTGINGYTTGDIIYASATNVLSKRAIGANNAFLQVQSGLPAYTTDFLWDNANHRLTIGGGNTNSQSIYNFVIGLNCSIDQGAWNFVLGEDNHVTKSGVNGNGIGDSGIFSGFQNKILLTDANPFSGVFETVIIGGYDNVSNDSTQGTMLGGNHNRLTASRSATVGGEWAEASGYTAWANGHQYDAGHAITPAPTQRVLSAGIHSFNFSSNNNSQGVGLGALADDSFILGGLNSHIPSTSPRSGVLGGNAIQARASDPDNIYVPYFNIGSISVDNALTQILARNSSTGKICFRDVSTIGAISGLTAGTIPIATSSTAIGDSIISEASSQITINGGLTVSLSGITIDAGALVVKTSRAEFWTGFRTGASGALYSFKEIDIGSWDMSSGSKNISHGLSSSQIIGIQIMIVDDSSNGSTPLTTTNVSLGGSGYDSAGSFSISSTQVLLSANPASPYVTSGIYSSTSINRGTIFIVYIP